MNKRWLLRVVVAGLTLLAFAWVGRHYSDKLPLLRSANPAAVALIVLVFVPTRVLMSEVMRVGLRGLGHRISTYEAFMVSMVNAYGNLLFPHAGLGVPAVYLKLKYAVPVADFATVQLLPMTLLHITTIGVTGVVCVTVMRLGQARAVDLRLLGLFAIVAGASLVGWAVRFNVPEKWTNRLAMFLRRISESWRRLGGSGHIASTAFVLHLSVLVLRGARLQLAFWAIGQPVDFFAAMTASLMADLAFFIGITPSALGFRELAVMTASGLLGAPKDICLAAVLLDRIIYTAVIIVVAQVGLWQLMRPVFQKAPAGHVSASPTP